MQLQYSFDLKTCPLGTEVGRGFSHLIAVVGLRELVVKAQRRGNKKKKKRPQQKASDEPDKSAQAKVDGLECTSSRMQCRNAVGLIRKGRHQIAVRSR